MMPFWLKVYRKLYLSSRPTAHSKAPTSAHKTASHMGIEISCICVLQHQTRKVQQKHICTPFTWRALGSSERTWAGIWVRLILTQFLKGYKIASETQSPGLAKIATSLGSVMPLLFRWFLILAEAANFLNRVDEEQGQPLPDEVLQGLHNYQQNFRLISPAKMFRLDTVKMARSLLCKSFLVTLDSCWSRRCGRLVCKFSCSTTSILQKLSKFSTVHDGESNTLEMPQLRWNNLKRVVESYRTSAITWMIHKAKNCIQRESNERFNRIHPLEYDHCQMNTKRAEHLSMFYRLETTSTKTLTTADTLRLKKVEPRSEGLLKKPPISYLWWLECDWILTIGNSHEG